MASIKKGPVKIKNFKVEEKGIPLEAFKDMTTGEIRKLDSQYRKLIKGGSK